MMVLWQNKIIYMPGLPPGTRREEIGDYAHQCRGVCWEEIRIRSEDGTPLTLAVASVAPEQAAGAPESSPATPPGVHVYILYFQGV
jgi:hypothetical protein